MKMLAGLPLLCGIASAAQASLTLVPTTPASHVGNLVVNGSFEDVTGGGPPGGGPGNWRLWATGTTLAAPPFAVPNGWTSSGNTNSYAMWGNDGGPLTMRNSDLLPDGEFALYFGNGGMATVDKPPTFNLDGSVSFPSAPTVTQPAAYPTPVTLTQTIPTSTNPAPKYIMSFWISSEAASFASDPNGDAMGIFGFKATNVLPGDPVQFLTVPSAADNPWGKSIRFDYEFVPLNSGLDVKIEFINYGHFDLTAFGRSSTTELVLDDVMVNTVVPEPASLSVVLGAMYFGFRRNRHR
jgi:hypothetical protein